MREGIRFTAFVFLTIAVVSVTILIYRTEVDKKQFKAQLDFLKSPDSFKSVSQITIDNYSQNSGKKLSIKDSSDIRKVMEAIASAGPRHSESRKGTINRCYMQIWLTNGEKIGVFLSVNHRQEVEINYRPANSDILSRESRELGFLFSDSL